MFPYFGFLIFIFYFLRFPKCPSIHMFQLLVYRKPWKEPIDFDLDPCKIKTYSTAKRYLFKDMFVLIRCAYVLKHRDSRNRHVNFRNFQGSTILMCCLGNPLWKDYCFGPTPNAKYLTKTQYVSKICLIYSDLLML